MTNIYSLEGLLSFVLIFIFSCTLIRRIKVLKSITDWKNLGILSIFHKASVIGTRLKLPVMLLCIILAIFILIK